MEVGISFDCSGGVCDNALIITMKGDEYGKKKILFVASEAVPFVKIRRLG